MKKKNTSISSVLQRRGRIDTVNSQPGKRRAIIVARWNEYRKTDKLSIHRFPINWSIVLRSSFGNWRSPNGAKNRSGVGLVPRRKLEPLWSRPIVYQAPPRDEIFSTIGNNRKICRVISIAGQRRRTVCRASQLPSAIFHLPSASRWLMAGRATMQRPCLFSFQPRWEEIFPSSRGIGKNFCLHRNVEKKYFSLVDDLFVKDFCLSAKQSENNTDFGRNREKFFDFPPFNRFEVRGLKRIFQQDWVENKVSLIYDLWREEKLLGGKIERREEEQSDLIRTRFLWFRDYIDCIASSFRFHFGKIGKIQEFEKDNARRRVPEENSLEGQYTQSTYKLRPITGSAAHRLAPKIKIRGREQSMARIFFFEITDRIYRFVEKGGKPRILLEMEKYRWSIAADFTYDWIAISPRHNTFLHAIVPFHQSFTNGGEVVSILIIELSPIVVERPIASVGMIAATNL